MASCYGPAFMHAMVLTLINSLQRPEADVPQPMEDDAAGAAPVTPQQPGIACLASLMQRCSDRAPTVRGKAVGNLASLLGSDQAAIIDWAKQARFQYSSDAAKSMYNNGIYPQSRCCCIPQALLQGGTERPGIWADAPDGVFT